MVREGFVYTISVYFNAFRIAILHHFALRLAPFYVAFSIKTHCI